MSGVAFLLAGQHTRYSVLDKVVPGYYYRRMENGDICMSTCCNNTASEHAMCERLVIDDMVHWAKDYKVPMHLAVTLQKEVNKNCVCFASAPDCMCSA